ncbi:MAG: hypothetical protein QF721_08790 [Verrucomicrobiota bacterium]|nr:hypothetical protein [Verrucomicrobiota bacterium]MDP7049535.1 hypothetical protein [Verrucomicrobiota bacterium]
MSEAEEKRMDVNPAIRLIGLGETGVKLVETLAVIAPEGVVAHSLDTDNRSLYRCHQSRTFLLGQAIPCGLGTGGDSALARAAVESDSDELAGIVDQADLVFIVAGMGGGTGTGAAPFLANLAKQAGALVVGVAATPFDCEGIQRCNQATGGLRDLKQVADAVFHFPNQDFIQLGDADIGLNQALEIANRHLCESVLGVSRMLLEPGILNVSFADLESLVRNRHSLGAVVHVEATGDDRTDDAVKKMLSHPAVRGGEMLKEANSLLVHISGAELTMAEMDTVTSAIGGCAPTARLVVGASERASGEAIQLTIVIAHTGTLAEMGDDTSSLKPDPAGKVSGLGFSDPYTAFSADSYLDLGTETGNSKRAGFAYTPPAPTADALPPECREDLIREAASEEPNRVKRRKIVQEMLPLEIVSKGRFENSEPTIHKGEDLDQPTYIRRGAILN